MNRISRLKGRDLRHLHFRCSGLLDKIRARVTALGYPTHNKRR